MSTNRQYYASQVLPSGKVWILGGEDYGPHLDPVVTATGEEWDPVTNKWSPIASSRHRTALPLLITSRGT